MFSTSHRLLACHMLPSLHRPETTALSDDYQPLIFSRSLSLRSYPSGAVSTCVYIYMYASVYASVYACAYACVYAYAYACVYAYVYAHTYAYIPSIVVDAPLYLLGGPYIISQSLIGEQCLPSVLPFDFQHIICSLILPILRPSTLTSHDGSAFPLY